MNQGTSLPPVDEQCPGGGACPIAPDVLDAGAAGIPDLCVSGYTKLTVVPCVPSVETPSPEMACQNPVWRDQLTICETIPLKGALPETGATSLPIAGTGLFAVVAGVVLLRFTRRGRTVSV